MITQSDIETVKQALRVAERIRNEAEPTDVGFIEILQDFHESGMTILSGMERRK
jgi:hypothetical protein